jgi:hypothetical protein
LGLRIDQVSYLELQINSLKYSILPNLHLKTKLQRKEPIEDLLLPTTLNIVNALIDAPKVSNRSLTVAMPMLAEELKMKTALFTQTEVLLIRFL